MTSADVAARPPSPASSAPNAEQPTNAELDKPVATSDAPKTSTANGNDHAPESAIVTQTSEPEQAIRATDEQPRTDQPQVEDTTTENLIPEVQSLKAIFPDIDVSIIEAVLHSVNGDQERATDVLLGMSDPNYVSQQPTTKSQTELDEEFARRLVFEEEQQQAAWHPDQQYPMAYDARGNPNVPYQPRMHHGPYYGSPPPQQQQAGSGNDTMEHVQTQFKQFAETGKKTFSSLFSKVKAKVQEFDQSRNQSSASQQGSWGSGTPSSAPGSGPTSSGQDRTQYAQYDISPSQSQGLSQSPPRDAVQGYDTQPPSAATPAYIPVPAPAVSPPPGERIPPRPPSAGNVDPSKIGMLPKRPVSLLGSAPNSSQSQPQSQPQTNTGAVAGTAARRNEDEDELDYVENPFEDGRK